jgi:hypothetical protein
MLKLIILFAYVIYFTSTQIKRFKRLCYYMDTLYLLRKIMQYSTPYIPPAPRYRPAYCPPMPSRTWGMMMFAKFFWEIFLSKILDPFFKNFFPEFLGLKYWGCFLKKIFWKIFGVIF